MEGLVIVSKLTDINTTFFFRDREDDGFCSAPKSGRMLTPPLHAASDLIRSRLFSVFIDYVSEPMSSISRIIAMWCPDCWQGRLRWAKVRTDDLGQYISDAMPSGRRLHDDGIRRFHIMDVGIPADDESDKLARE